MSIEKFVAPDSKSALEKVKMKLGGNALILSTKRTDSGIEVSATSGDLAESGNTKAVKATPTDAINDITLGYLDRELKALREILYKVLGERAWEDVAGKKPISSVIEARLHTLGLSKPSIDAITTDIDVASSLNTAWSATLENLVSAVESASDSVAKTDSTPKAVIGGSSTCRSVICRQLITQALEEGLKPSQILVVSMTPDPSEALLDFCKRRKIKRIQASSLEKVRICLKRMSQRKKILIESPDLTPSLGVHDPVAKLLSDNELGIEAISVLPALHQSEVLRTVYKHIEDTRICGTVVSQISEAVSLGAVFDALILNDFKFIGVSRRSDKVVQSLTAGGLLKIAKRLAREKVEDRKFTPDLASYSRTA
jgi:flagellar biosynthesis protein FlhF